MAKKYFKVCTFNLLNLALPGERYYNREYRHDEFTRKVAWVSNQLNRMNADIIGFQEVFHKPALEQVLQASGKYEGAEIVMGERNGEGPAVALVSRFNVLEYTVVSDFPPKARLEFNGTEVPIYQFSRPVMKARVEVTPELSCDHVCGPSKIQTAQSARRG